MGSAETLKFLVQWKAREGNRRPFATSVTEMTEKDSDGEAALLPGLPDEIVLFNVISRLPWFARPVFRAVSKAWRAWIDTSTKRRDILIKSRQHLLPLLHSRFLLCTFDHRTFISEACHGPRRPDRRAHFLLCTFDHRTLIAEACHGPRQERRSGYHCVEWRDRRYQICRQWRELPSLQKFFPPPSCFLSLMATDGMVYAWASEKPHNFVLKIDLAAGDWTWKKLPVPSPFNHLVVPFKGKIYVPSVSANGKSVTGEGGEMVVVHDMSTEEFEVVRTWKHDNLRVLRHKMSESSSGICEEELYSFVEHTAASESGTNLEIIVYDHCNDSWMTKVILPIPECPEWEWSDILDVKLLNGDCFEPVPDGGINAVWVTNDSFVLSWFNSSLHKKTWVDFEYHPFWEGKSLDYVMVMHGCLFGIFYENEAREHGIEEETKDGRAEDREHMQDPSVFKRSIMKGKMVVKTSNVQWEKVLDIGCFEESYFVQVALIVPVDDYAFMA